MYPAVSIGPVALPELLNRTGLPSADVPDVPITHAAPLNEADGQSVSFFENPKYLKQLRHTQAAAVFVTADIAPEVPASVAVIVVPAPYAAFAQTVAVLYPLPPVVPGIDASAHIADTAHIAKTCRIDAGAVIQAGAVIADGVHIGAHVLVGESVHIGAHSRIGAQTTLLNAHIGARALIHPGVRIGQDGYGFARLDDTIHKVPQIGTVRIGDDVEIGANSCIDRGTLTTTTIGDGTKIDALVKIAHNVQIGRGVRIVGQTGIAGSTTIGDFALIGGQAGTAGHIHIADEVQVAGRSGVTKNITEAGSTVAGFPAMPYKQWQKLQGHLRRLLRGEAV